MKEKRNFLEWIVLGLSTLATVTVFAYLVYQAFHSSEEVVPHITVTPGQAAAAPDGQFQVPVVAHNRGPAPADLVGVEVELEGAPEKEVVEFELQRLPREGTRKVYVMFAQDPRLPGRTVRARVTHSQLP